MRLVNNWLALTIDAVALIAIQGGTCGFGNRGQKARSGSGTRPGFEGGQTALYRRLPKLRGIAGGKHNGLCRMLYRFLPYVWCNFSGCNGLQLGS